MKNELIPNLFRSEYSKIVSVLSKLFGISNIQIAEDLVSETFLIAAETWGKKGVPENPKAWLYLVAKNKTKDLLKHNAVFNSKIEPELKHNSSISEEIEIDLSDKNIKDSQLQMLFAICNPVINSEAQIGLALRILCGFGINEIADAFLSNKQTINKRLFRAKEKLRKENIIIEYPGKSEIKGRLENVLLTLYLLFNEGYYSVSKNTELNQDLCFEAMRLVKLLLDNLETNLPKINALMSLMCFHSSRFKARVGEKKVLYQNQNTELWDKELIEKGIYYLIKSSQGKEITKYHFESRIAYWHTQKEDTNLKWESILQLYNQLLQINYSPIIALNRTFALSKARGNKVAIPEAEKLIANFDLKNNPFYFMLMANLFESNNKEKCLFNLNKAFILSKNEFDKEFIKNKINYIL